MAYDKALASLTTYCEASSGTPMERRCVMHTFFNRILHKIYGATIAEVCLRRHQYSEWNGDAVDNANLRRAARVADSDPIMLDCEGAYDEVQNGGVDITLGATHYNDHSIPPPYWAAQATVTIITNKFTFYKDVP